MPIPTLRAAAFARRRKKSDEEEAPDLPGALFDDVEPGQQMNEYEPKTSATSSRLDFCRGMRRSSIRKSFILLNARDKSVYIFGLVVVLILAATTSMDFGPSLMSPSDIAVSFDNSSSRDPGNEAWNFPVISPGDRSLWHIDPLGHRHYQTTVLLDEKRTLRYPGYSFQSNLPPLRHHASDRVSSHFDMESLLFADEDEFQRRIRPDDEKVYEQERYQFLRSIDDKLDEEFYHYEELRFPRDCVRPRWAYKSFPTCNSFHEYQVEGVVTDRTQATVDYTVDFIASGYYRDTWIMATPASDFVMKRLRLKREFTFDHWTDSIIHSEALVLERLSQSPFVTDLYGHCGTSMVVERANEVTHDIVPHLPRQKIRGRISQSELDELEAASPDGIVSFNNWTVPEKLTLSVQLISALNGMHNNPGGTIMHDDIHPDQWLISNDGDLKLNDVNNAVVLDWNQKKERNCKFYVRYNGMHRGPEEYLGSDVDESADIWPTGFLIFSVLTGLWPYYNETSQSKMHEAVINGIPPYINPKFKTRSTIEGRLVELMSLCFKRRPEDRATMSQLLEHLQETVRLDEAEQ